MQSRNFIHTCSMWEQKISIPSFKLISVIFLITRGGFRCSFSIRFSLGSLPFGIVCGQKKKRLHHYKLSWALSRSQPKHMVWILLLSAHRPVVSSWGEGRRQRLPARPSHCPCSHATLAWRYSKFGGSYPQCLSPGTLGTTRVAQQRSRQYCKIPNSAHY